MAKFLEKRSCIFRLQDFKTLHRYVNVYGQIEGQEKSGNQSQ